MKCKVFYIPLTDNRSKPDETELNAFIQRVIAKKIFASTIDEQGRTCWSVLIFYEEDPLMVQASRFEKELVETNITLTPTEERTYRELKRWRNERASTDGVAPYVVAHNKELQQIVTLPVKTKYDLLKVKGFRYRKIEKYGDDIIRIHSKIEGEANLT